MTCMGDLAFVVPPVRGGGFYPGALAWNSQSGGARHFIDFRDSEP